MIDILIQLASFTLGVTYTFWSTVFFVPLFITFTLFNYIKQLKSQIGNKIKTLSVDKFSLVSIRAWVNKITAKIILSPRQSPISRLLRQSRSEQQVNQTLLRAAANPLQITQNQKVVMLMQKMQRLQQILYQQSVDRRKAENQLFELRQKFQEKSSALVKEKSQCVENLNKINVLKLELAEKTQNLEKSSKYVFELEQEIKNMKQNIKNVMKEEKKEVKIEEEEHHEKQEQNSHSAEKQQIKVEAPQNEEKKEETVETEKNQEQHKAQAQEKQKIHESTQKSQLGQKNSIEAQPQPTIENESIELEAQKKKKKKGKK